VDIHALQDLALAVACKEGWEECVVVLLRNGADPTARDGLSMRVAQMCEWDGVVNSLAHHVK
jgi:hypothetical protein